MTDPHDKAAQTPVAPAAGRGEDFSALAAGGRRGTMAEMWLWMRHNKKWWLLPILLVLGLLGLLAVAGATGLGAFIYPLL